MGFAKNILAFIKFMILISSSLKGILFWLMGVNMMDSGKLENKMELAGIMVSIIQVVKVNG